MARGAQSFLKTGAAVLLFLLACSISFGAQRGSSARGSSSSRRAVASCSTAKDLVVQALERLRADSPPADLEDADQLLRRAIDLCTDSGDAWYYRSLVEAKLNRQSKADFAMTQARMFSSEALQQQLNPFVLATPASRGFIVQTPATGKEVASQAAPAKPAPVVPGPVQHKWALVVGISHFQDKSIRSLNFTTQDANAFRDELQDPQIGQFPADHVKIITDADATTKNIKEQLNWIARNAEPNDLVVIYVATHGSPRSVDSVSGINYLVTYDTEMSTGGQFDEDAMFATALPMVELANDVATRMKALRTLVILDTCYSGGSIVNLPAAPKTQSAKAAPTKQMLDLMDQGTGRIVLAASRSDEESLESAKLGHGYFTYFLLQALKSGKGYEPVGQVFGKVEQSVSKLAAESGGSQHPVIYKSSSDTDFSLRAASNPAAKTGF